MFEIAIIIAVIVGLVQLVKKINFLPARYLPVLSLVLGVAAGIFYIPGTVEERIMYGLMIGLSSAGLFDQSKIVTKKGEK